MRGPDGDLAPSWLPPNDAVDNRDPWMLRLTYAAIGSAVLLFVLWGSYAVSLRSTTRAIRGLAPASAVSAAVPTTR